jgi:hypothetical protein
MQLSLVPYLRHFLCVPTSNVMQNPRSLTIVKKSNSVPSQQLWSASCSLCSDCQSRYRDANISACVAGPRSTSSFSSTSPSTRFSAAQKISIFVSCRMRFIYLSVHHRLRGSHAATQPYLCQTPTGNRVSFSPGIYSPGASSQDTAMSGNC